MVQILYEFVIKYFRYADRVKGLNADDGGKLNAVREESMTEEESEEQSAIDMLASNNSEEFSPEMVAITKAQVVVDNAEESMTLSVSFKFCNIDVAKVYWG